MQHGGGRCEEAAVLLQRAQAALQHLCEPVQHVALLLEQELQGQTACLRLKC